jgi:hypothetical protein
MAGGMVKQNGRHDIATLGGHRVSIDVKDGKIAGLQVKHDQKGDVAVTKYKTTTKAFEMVFDGDTDAVEYVPVT